jgi:hypothetical protein
VLGGSLIFASNLLFWVFSGKKFKELFGFMKEQAKS